MAKLTAKARGYHSASRTVTVPFYVITREELVAAAELYEQVEEARRGQTHR